MINFKNSKQLTINKQHRLGSHGEQPLQFPLVHLILCSATWIICSAVMLNHQTGAEGEKI